MAAPAFGSVGTPLAGATNANADIPVPSGVASGNIVLAALYIEPETPTVTPASGFTEVPGSPAQVTGFNAHEMRVYWKRATGADTGTYPFVLSGVFFRAGFAMRFTGCVASGNPFDVTNSAVKTATIDGSTPAVSVTTTGVDRLLVWTAAGFNGGGCSTPTGFTELIDDGGLVADAMSQLVAGSSGSVTATFVATGSTAAWLGALLPVGGAPGNTSKFTAMFF